jgi:hypothetical protein
MAADRALSSFLDSWLAVVEPPRWPTTVPGYRDNVRRWKAARGRSG